MYEKINRRGALALGSAFTLGLGGCSSAGPAGSSLLRREPVKQAGFKLADVQLRWQDNPAFGYEIRYTKPVSDMSNSASSAAAERAKSYMAKVMGLFRAQGVPTTTDRLLKAGVTFGSTYTLVLVPLSGQYDATGARCGMTVRAMVQNAQRKTLYLSDIDSRSGWHVTGLYIPDPDEAFVNNFADALVSTFREAGLLA